MTKLHDVDVLEALKTGAITIKPFCRDNLGPASYDVTLFNNGRILTHKGVLDLVKEVPDSKIVVLPYILSPGETIILLTNEIIGCDDCHDADIIWRHNLGMIPLSKPDGFVDPGYLGPLTLRYTNGGNFPVKLRPDMRIAQIVFYKGSKCLVPYNKRKSSKNVGQTHFDIPNYKPDKEWSDKKIRLDVEGDSFEHC